MAKRQKVKVKIKAAKQPKIKTKRTGAKNGYVIGIICIFAAALISFWGLPYIKESTSNEVELYVADSDIEKGTLITQDAIKKVNLIDTAFIPPNVIKTQEEIIGMYAQADIMANDFITTGKVDNIVPYYDAYLYELPENKMAISVTIKSFASGLSKKIRPGDIVSIYSVNKTGEQQGIIGENHIALKYVKVLAVTDYAGYDVDLGVYKNATEDEQIVENITITVMADDIQASLLAGYEISSGVHIALVCREKDDRAAGYLKAQEEINASLDLHENGSNGQWEDISAIIAEEPPESIENEETGDTE